MKIKRFETKDEWMKARNGKITGSSLADIVSQSGATKEIICNALDELGIEYDKKATKDVLMDMLPVLERARIEVNGDKKIGFYELIAKRIAIAPDGENPMDRGTRLEPEAIARFVKETGKKVDSSLVIWERDDNDSIALSPDAFIENKKGLVTEAVEAKCLSSADHIKAFLTQEIPDKYKWQTRQYFIVNKDLENLYFCFYDPRVMAKDFFFILITRKDVEKDTDFCLEFEKLILKEVEDVVNELTGF